MVLENEFIRAEFHRATARLLSLVNKETGEEFIGGAEGAGLAVVTMERMTNNAWKIGRYLKTEQLTQPVCITPLTDGDLQTSFAADYRWGMSKMKVIPMLRAGDKALSFCVEVEWNEVTGAETAPLLTFNAPLSFTADKYLCDVPGGALYRKPQNMDMPCLQFCAAVRGNGSVLAMIPDSKYGYRATENNLAVSLINTSNNPDPFPDRGLHTINIALAPARENAKVLEDTATAINHPTYFLSNNSHPGTLPMDHSFLDFRAESTVLSAVLPEEGGMTLRWYENGGKEDKLTFRFSKPAASVITTDLNGHEVPSDAAVKGCEVTLTAKPSSLGQMTVTF